MARWRTGRLSRSSHGPKKLSEKAADDHVGF
jgi:hypothetical protein